MPASKRKCPECKKEVIVRSHNKIKILMTPEETLQFDTAIKKRHEIEIWLGTYIRITSE